VSLWLISLVIIQVKFLLLSATESQRLRENFFISLCVSVSLWLIILVIIQVKFITICH